MKQLIVDYLPFEIKPEQITESMKENDGKLVVRGVLQRAESKNQNGRVYPKDVLMRESKKYHKEFIKQSGLELIACTEKTNKTIYDYDFRKQNKTYEWPESVIIQHEVDHLNGYLISMKGTEYTE